MHYNENILTNCSGKQVVLPTGCTHSVGILAGGCWTESQNPRWDHGTNDWCIIKECIPLPFQNRLTELFRNADDKTLTRLGG